MSGSHETNESAANQLCKACGLCCTGHLFIWTKLRSAELDAIEKLGVNVLRSVPSQRGFNQPCPLWQGQCTIYDSLDYPRFCRTYRCKLLKRVLDETTSLTHALKVIQKTKDSIQEVEALLPPLSDANFRERLVSELERATAHEKVLALAALYEDVFGVDDLIEDRIEP